MDRNHWIIAAMILGCGISMMLSANFVYRAGMVHGMMTAIHEQDQEPAHVAH